MAALPWGDWQFWTVTLLAVGALGFFLRPFFSRRRSPRCSNCEACPPQSRQPGTR